jgi:hypothetical protein
MTRGNGTQAQPWDLVTALSSDSGIRYRDRLNLANGSYGGAPENGHYVVAIGGNSLGNATIRSGSAILQGSLRLANSYITVSNIEIYDADFIDRETEETSSVPSDIPNTPGVKIEYGYSKIINCIIHDTQQGILALGTNNEFYGNLIYYNGWSAPNRGHGHGIYAANNNETPLRIIDNIIHSQFGYNLHCYAEGGDGSVELLQNIQVEGCTVFGSYDGDRIGGSGYGSTVRTSWMKNCCIYDDIRIGGVTSGCTDFTLQNNVIIGNLTMLFYGATPTITGNKFFGTVAITNGDTPELLDAPTVFPDNEYLSAIPDVVDLRANTYDANKAKLTIFNGSEADTVNVDVSAIFGQSGTVKAHNVQDYFVDIQTLTITSGSITMNMQAANRTVATPQGWTAPAKTFPTFGAFVLVKQ